MHIAKTSPDQPKRLGLYLRESKATGDKEVEDQRRVGVRWAERNGCKIPDGRIYVDNDLSASYYATRARKDFERLCRDIEAGRLDLVWFWSLSRSQRRLDVYVRLRDLCQKHNVDWVIDGRVFDLTDPMDLRSLGNSAVDDEVFSRQLSKNVRRGLAENAAAGKPHSRAPYGYRRIYNERREYVNQIPDEPAASVAREIITRISKGHSIAQIKRDLEERQTPAPWGGPVWSRSAIRVIAQNKAYIGTRVHRPTDGGPISEVEGAWPALVEPDVFAKAQAVLTAPGRKFTKPARARSLLSYVARCACEAPMQTKVDGNRRTYACEKRCTSISADDLDLFVQAVIDAYLAREDVQAFLLAGQGDSEDAQLARAEAARLREEAEEWRKLADAGEVTPLDYARFSRSLRARIEDADERAEAASVSPVIPREVDWSDLPVARQAVAALADVRVRPVGKGRRDVRVNKRVIWDWKIGPGSSV